MTEDSLAYVKSAIPVIVIADTVWLGLLSYWTTSRISDLTSRISKLEAENKALKKRSVQEDKARSNEMKRIVSTLKQHDERIERVERSHREVRGASKSRSKTKSSHKPRKPISSSSQEEGTESIDEDVRKASKSRSKTKPSHKPRKPISSSSNEEEGTESIDDDLTGLYQASKKK